MARPKGTNREYSIAKKVVDTKLDLEALMQKNVMSACRTIVSIANDVDAADSMRLSASKTIVEMYNKFYKERKGKDETSLDQFKQSEIKDKTDEGGKPQLISLSMEG